MGQPPHLASAPLLLVLAVGGMLLINPPLLPVEPRLIFGLPVTGLYLLVVWLGVLAVVRWLLPRGPDD